MKRYIIGAALVLGLALVATQSWAADEDTLKAQKDILDVTKEIEAGKDVTAKIAALRKKYDDMEHLMQVYKPRERGGLGVGPKSKGDGIEFKIVNLGKRKLTAGQLEKEKDDLIKMANVNIAMAKITAKFTPAKKGKEWNMFSSDMEKASKALLDAVKKGDPEAVRKAAANLNSSCNGCHSDIRDS